MKALLFAAALLVTTSVHAKVAVGEAAPAFTLNDAQGKPHSLADYKGKTVVLEWNNPECPFVRKHYDSHNIPRQQADATAAGVVWLTVNSAADGKQGHVDGAAAAQFIARTQAKPTAYLIDADGKVGHLYGARTTPHVFVIDGGGVLRYMGGIDSVPSTDQDDLKTATQYVPQALRELAAGKAVSVPTSEPYGCSVKYGT